MRGRLSDVLGATRQCPQTAVGSTNHQDLSGAALVAAAGYLPLTLAGEDYLELLPVAWRAINDYGVRIDYRTYDSPQLGRWRRQHSGVTDKRGLWEVHYDPYDLSRVFVRTPDGWVIADWTHLLMVAAPFADRRWLLGESDRRLVSLSAARR